MKKALSAILLAVLPGLAQAQSSVTLFGTLGGGIRWVNGVKGGGQAGFDDNSVAGNLYGLKGREDLGGGIKAIFALAGQFSIGTGTLQPAAALFGQTAYVGVSGPFGRVTLGRQFNASGDLGVLLDPAGGLGPFATEPGVLFLGNYFTVDPRFNNTIKYLGEAGGLRFSASYSPGGVAGNQRAGTNFSAAGLYQYQGATVGVSYGKTYSPDGTQAAQTIMAGGMLQLGPVRVQVANASFDVTAKHAGGATRRDNLSLVGLIWQMTPSLQLTGALYDDIGRNLGNVPGANGHKITSYLIAEYFLSKRTEIYAEVDRNGFTGAYKRDPVNLAGLNLRPGASATTGVSVGLMTRF
ncbi:porin [Burkholderia sp. HI2761]|uniref:porin n=1 Tax=unclassified Burkholderia TaxID=2613784 RepID=UPI000B7A5E55|nr:MULTISPECIES: porin [unclassified Burkholderia]MPV55952.1 porin [Burkholderia sp. BE24]OXJ27381.1 porin [Burkholderia sp. HI2761]